MNYKSTRSLNQEYVSSAVAIKNGLAPDGGLYMPMEIPELTENELIMLQEKSYPEKAAYIMGKFLSEYTYEELLSDCELAYSEAKFPGGPAPLKQIDDKVYSLELWHGPTCAFKDMALQIMPRLLSRALKKTEEKRTALILVATSGDTGKAALEGYRDVEGIKIKVFYPQNGVSRVQKLQMATQEGENVDVCAIHGNFDDAQNGVKAIFSDIEFGKILNENNTFLSSANSINWGRLVPQVVYYISAYCDMVKNKEIALGEKVDICVPTGNFGNIFAGYIAKMMKLPIDKLVCASNKNNILTDFLETGTYDRNRKFFTTISPSMDILISSNLERLIYLVCGSEKTAKYMSDLKEYGRYTLAEEDFKKIKEHFCGYFCDEENTKKTICDTFKNHNYLIDTHTAVGYHCALQFSKLEGGSKKIILASTASPFKFASDVYTAVSGKAPTDELLALDELSKLTSAPIPAPLNKIGERKVRFDSVCHPCEMKDTVLQFADK